MRPAICLPRSINIARTFEPCEAPAEDLELRWQANVQLTRAYHMLVGADAMNSMDCGVDPKIPTPHMQTQSAKESITARHQPAP